MKKSGRKHTKSIRTELTRDKELSVKERWDEIIIFVPKKVRKREWMETSCLYIWEHYGSYVKRVNYSFDERTTEEIAMDSYLDETKRMAEAIQAIYEIVRGAKLELSEDASEIFCMTAFAIMKVYVMAGDYEKVNTFGVISEFFAVSANMTDEIDVMREYMQYQKEASKFLGKKSVFIILILIAAVVLGAMIYTMIHHG